jgi:2-haloacid dehalogenase
LRTAFIARPKEYGPTRKADQARAGDFDIVSRDILDLAGQLGA